MLLVVPASVGAVSIVSNVEGHTPVADGIRTFTVMVVDDGGKILATGDEALLARFPDAVRIDGRGNFVLPGLIDTHAHVLSFGIAKTRVDLVGTGSLEEALARLDRYARSNPDEAWVLGRGWNQELWPERRFPRAGDLDALIDERPVWLRRIDGHAGWANSRALEISGISRDTPDPEGGRILRDENGDATGILIDKAMALIEDRLPATTRDDIRRAVELAIPTLLSFGLTGVHDAGIDREQAEVYRAMADDGALDLRIYAMIAGAAENLDAIGKPIRRYGNDRLEIASVKLYSDGALGSRGAAMIEPYHDEPASRGLPFWTQDQLEGFVAKANGMGFQVGIHAIGDLGNRMSLDAFDRVQRGRPSPLRNRIEHAQVISLEDLPRFRALGVIAAMQPTHATSDMNMAENRVGPERIAGAYAWRRLLDSGAVIAAGSDFPIEHANPFHGLYAAVSRQSRDGKPEGGWYADQAMTRAEALRSFTLDAAYAAHQEDRLGSLEPGKWADFIIVDRNYFDVPVDQIDDIRVLETWIGGKRVYAYAGPAEAAKQ